MILKHINDIVSVCAGHGVNTAIISPGSRSAPLTLAFNQYSSIDVKVIGDERSAAFIALGIAQQQGKTVVLVCTSGSAVYNYAPAIAEAYFQEVPLLVLSADRPPEWVNQYDGQTIQQSSILHSHVKASFDFPVDATHKDAFWHSNRMTNEALITSQTHPKGPVHINIPLREPFYPSLEEKIEFPKTRIIRQTAPELVLSDESQLALCAEWSKYTKRAIVIGQCALDTESVSIISDFAKRTNTVLINDIIGNHHLAEDVIQHQDTFLQPGNHDLKDQLKLDLLITIGKSLISKNLKLFLRDNPPKAHWHIRNSDRVNDTLQHLTRWIKLDPRSFFSKFNPTNGEIAFKSKWHEIDDKTKNTIKPFLADCPFGEFQALSACLSALPLNSQLHLANSMTVRYANLLGLHSNVEVFANRGTSGIDGSNGTAVGAVLSQNKLVTLITGDMAFFYDRNSFWHKYDLSRLRIILLNNHGGGIFRMIKGPKEQADYEKLFETDQPLTANNTAKDHNFEYHTCSDLTGLNIALDNFYDHSDQPKLIEVFSESKQNTEIFNSFKEQF